MKKELTCVICPNGCELEVEYQVRDNSISVLGVKGELCKKGPKWAERELINPVRTITTSVLVEGGDLPLVSVRTSDPIPVGMIFEVMEEIKKLKVKAPIRIGQVLLRSPKGLKTDIIATRDVNLQQ